MTIEHLEEVGSTNDYIKKYVKNREDAIVFSDIQTMGKGTKGRSFISQKGGIYMSQLKFYPCLPCEKAFTIMQNSAVAVCKTLMAFGIFGGIKWPNDIIVNGKKICGILIQNSFCGQNVDYSIVGIGLNVNNRIDKSIEDIAISMKDVLGTDVDPEKVRLTLIANLSMETTNEEYKQLSTVIGKEITIIRGDKTYKAKAVEINESGSLILESGEILSAGEIKLKIK